MYSFNVNSYIKLTKSNEFDASIGYICFLFEVLTAVWYVDKYLFNRYYKNCII